MLSRTFKGHVDASSQSSHITINNATIDMHGRYKCTVKTDLNTHDTDHDLIVISQSSCKPADWRISSEPGECRESLRLDCRHLFPRPVPSCGLWNGQLDKFIRSVSVDIGEEPNGRTFSVGYADKFQLVPAATPGGGQQPVDKAKLANQSSISETTSAKSKPAGSPVRLATTNSHLDEPFEQAGGLVFKCDILVPDTSWRLSLNHKMFDYQDGCHESPLDAVERFRQSFSQQTSARFRAAMGQHKPKGFQNQQQHQQHEQADFELLAGAGLGYELLPAPNQKQPDFNCWRRPKLGSLAKLSCEGRHTKLVGASLMECRPDGWTLLSPTPTAGATSTNSGNPRRAATRSGRRANQGAANDSSLTLNAIDTSSERASGAGSSLTSSDGYEIHATNESDLDPDDSDDSDPAQATRRAKGEASSERAQVDHLAHRHQASAPTTPATGFEQQVSRAPGQLAALLPSCVSTSQRVASAAHKTLQAVGSGATSQQRIPMATTANRHQHELSSGSNSLGPPMLDGTAMESSSPDRNHLRPTKGLANAKRTPLRAASSGAPLAKSQQAAMSLFVLTTSLSIMSIVCRMRLADCVH